MPRSFDRLLMRSTCRLALRSAGLASPEAVLSATPDQLTRLDVHRAEILALVKAGNADVVRALFLPQEPIDWQLALITSEPGVRLLTVTRGSAGRVVETPVSLTFSDREGERRAWRALVRA